MNIQSASVNLMKSHGQLMNMGLIACLFAASSWATSALCGSCKSVARIPRVKRMAACRITFVDALRISQCLREKTNRHIRNITLVTNIHPILASCSFDRLHLEIMSGSSQDTNHVQDSDILACHRMSTEALTCHFNSSKWQDSALFHSSEINIGG